MTAVRLLCLCLAVVALLEPARALGFSDQDRFGQPAIEGGGSGRYFVGTPADGFDCTVCHADDLPSPPLEITGLPARYVPGESYEIILAWQANQAGHGAAIELAHGDGTHAGVVEWLPTGAPEESCAGDDAPVAIRSAEPNRTVVTVDNCGILQVRLVWTAPAEGDVFFGAGVVRSNASGTADGDAVATRLERIAQVGTPFDTTGTCSSSGPPRSAGSGESALLLLALGLLVRRRR